MALATTKVFLHIRADSDGDRTKHDAKKSLRKLAGGLTLTLDDADVVVFHHGSEMVLQNALGLRKPVVSPMWLKACKEAGRKLDVEPFVLVDSNSSAAVIKANASPVATPPKMLSKKPSPNATPPIPVGSANAAAKRPVVPSAPIALVDDEDDDDAALLAPKLPTSSAAAAAASTTAMKPKDESPTPKKSASGRKSAAKAASDSELAPAVVDKIAPAAVARAAESNASAAATAAYLADLLDDEESPPPVPAPAAAKAKKPKAKAAVAKKSETGAASEPVVSPAGKKRGRTSTDTAVGAPTPPQPKADVSDASSPAAAAAADPKRERKKPGPKPKQTTTLTELARTQPAAASASPAAKATLTASASGAAAVASDSPAKASAGKKKAAAATAAKEAPAAPKPKAKKAKKKAATAAAPVTVIAGSALRSSSDSSSSSSSDSDSDDGTGPGPARTSSAAHSGRVVGGVHKYQIALTGVTADEREALGQIVVALGGEVVEEVFGRNGTKPTHLVADGATSSVSPKILLALGLGLPILRPAWLFSSLSHGRWLSVDGADGDGQPFFVPSFDKASWLSRQELMYHRDPRMLPDRPARGPQFLTGIVLYFAGASSYPDNNVWAELVHTVGGDVVRTVAAAGLSAVVLMSKDALKSGSGRRGGPATRSSSTLPKWLQNTPPAVPVITPQWIADSIAACATVPFDAHLAENVPVRPSLAAEPLSASLVRAGVAGSDDSPPSLQVVGRTSTAPPGQRLSTGAAAAAAGRSPGTPHQAALAMALKKRSPGPSSAMKEAAHQWSTQMLRESLSPTRHDSDDDDA